MELLNRITICLLLVLSTVFVSAQGIEQIQGRQLEFLPMPNSNPWLYLEVGGQEYYAVMSRSRLFRALRPEPVRVEKVVTRGNDIEVHLSSQNLGKGRIKFENGKSWPANISQQMINLVVTDSNNPPAPRFVGHRHSKMLHFKGCNHLPAGESQEHFHTAEEGQEEGYRKCPLCFTRFPGYSAFDVERQIANFQAASLRSQAAPLMDIESQERVKRIGNEVLQKWPAARKGYRYRFTVLDTDEANAAACADGQIFITRGLLDSLESDDEVAAVLAHEIGHVEMRHTYRRWRSMQKAAFWTGLATVLVAATTDSQAATEAAASLSTFAANLVLKDIRDNTKTKLIQLLQFISRGTKGQSTHSAPLSQSSSTAMN
jgi:hypothetical protein